jgi:hypothetical protein
MPERKRTMSETHERNGYPREIEEDSPPSPPPSLERLAYQVREERTERLRQHKTQEIQIAGLMAETGELSALVRNSEEARAEDMRAIRKALGDLSEGQGRIAAELARGARQQSIHEDAIAATKTELALARAKWLGWRGFLGLSAASIAKALWDLWHHVGG